MSSFRKEQTGRTILVNVKLTEKQVADLDRITESLSLSSRSDVLREALECLLKHNPKAAAAVAQLD